MTNLEELQSQLLDELAAVPTASGSLNTVTRRGRKRKAVRRTISTFAGIGVAVAAIAVSTMLMPAYPRVEPAASPDGPVLVRIDEVFALPAGQPIERIEAHEGTFTALAGYPAAEPTFPTDQLGIEQPILRSMPRFESNAPPPPEPTIYVGDVNGRSVFVHSTGWPIFDRFIDRIFNTGRADHICITVGDEDTIGGDHFCSGGLGDAEFTPIYGSFFQSDRGYLGQSVTWLNLPQETSVVAIELDDGRKYWQQAVSQVSFFDLEGQFEGEVKMSALDATGTTLQERVVPVFIDR